MHNEGAQDASVLYWVAYYKTGNPCCAHFACRCALLVRGERLGRALCYRRWRGWFWSGR